MSNTIIIENNSLGAKEDSFLIPEKIEKIKFAGFVYNGYITIYNIKSKKNNKIFIDKSNFFRYEFVRPFINYEVIDLLELLRDYSKSGKYNTTCKK